MASLALTVDGQSLTATLTPPPPAPSVSAAATWDTTTVGDGSHTLGATATDQAGTTASTTRVVIVDNTPPETVITSAPPGAVNTSPLTLGFTGTDNLTPVANLLFAWRLDGGAWSAFAPATSATLTGLTEGSHTFEVKALDLAGNEDPTPAAVSFTVRFGPSITSVNPVGGPVGTYVAITGTNFEPGATQVTFNGLAAVVRTITATTITTTVPIGATTGPLTVTTGRGSASVVFAVLTTGDFTLSAAPAPPASARVIAGDQTSISVQAGGTGSFTSLVTLSLSAPPTGITASFSPSNLVAPGASAFLTLAVVNTVAPGSYDLTVTGEAQVDGRTLTRIANFTLEVLAPETPAITGRVLTAEAVPKPIPGVTITLGSAFTLTDAGGNFVLLAPPPGANMLLVDGRTASTPTAQYPPVEVQIDVAASGPTRVPFVLYLPVLDTAHPVTLPLDAGGFTTAEVQATTPLIPGLVVTIPQGTKITGPDGNPVSQITITPVPIDRTPMPFPGNVIAPMLFTIQPGGAVPSQPLAITFPNLQRAPEGTPATLYYFDLSAGTWASWGTGRVTADGTQVVSDPGFGLPRFAWHFPWCPVSPPDAVRIRHVKTDEPVDLVSGRFLVNKTDLVLPGRVPVSLQRFYRSEFGQAGLLGIGWTVDLYDSTLTTAGTGFALVRPDQSTVRFAPAGPGQWANADEPEFRGALLTALPGEFRFQLRFKDGTVHRFERLLGFANAAALAALTDRYGNTVTLTRVPQAFQNHRITRITEPAGRAIDLTYDTAGRLAQVTDPLGRTAQYAYDVEGRLETVTDPAGGVTRYAYDSQHRILSITDPRGIAFITNEYDPVTGRVTRQIQADGGVWSFAYTLTGNIVTQTVVTDPRGNPTTYRFNAEGFTLSRTDALGQTTLFEYLPGSNLLAVITDPLGRTIRYDYDGQGNLARIVQPDGTDRRLEYEPVFNRLTAMIEPLGRTTRYEYDALGNMTARVAPGGARTTVTYLADGSPATITDPQGHVTTLTYDAFGNLATVQDPPGNVSRREYDVASRLLRTTTPTGRTTQFAYDALDRVVQLTDAAGGVIQYTYDPNGNLLTLRNPQGMTTEYTYDVMDRVIARKDPLQRTKTLTYDLAGNLVQTVDQRGQLTAFVSDAVNRRVREIYTGGVSVDFVYDAGSRLVRIIDSEGGVIEHEYDSNNRLIRETTAHGTVAYTYDVLGRQTTVAIAGEPVATYGYDIDSRVRSITRASLSPLTLDYDVRGLLTRLVLPNGVTTTYEYDGAARLTRLLYESTAAGVLGDLTYQHASDGRRIRTGGTFARIALPDATATATYDAANQQLAFGDRTMSFDDNGNLVQLTEPGSTTLFTWDARDRLRAISTGGSLTTLTYDALGRRSGRTVDGLTTTFQYSRGDVVRESRVGGDVLYLRGLAVDQQFYENQDTGYLLDGSQTTIALVDAGGALSQSFTYEPFGRTETTGDPDRVRYQFTGRERDSADLYYFRARYYSPRLGRFIQPDPLGLAAGVNLYAYASNDPISLIDPFGLKTFVAHGTSTQGTSDDWPEFLDALRKGGDPDTYLFRWSGSLGETLFAPEGPAGDLVNRIIAELTLQPLKPGERLSLVGHSGGAVVVNEAARMLRARGIKVDNLIVFGAPAALMARPPADVPVTVFVGRYDPLKTRLSGPNATSFSVETGSSDAQTAHTSYTKNPFVITTIQGLIRARPPR